MRNKKKVLFILPSLGAGGAEKVMSFVCKSLNYDLFEPKLIVLGFEKENVFDVSNISVTYLNKPRLLLAIPSLFKVIVSEKPNVVIGSIIHINVIMGFFTFFFPKIKFIGREASVVSKMNEFSGLNSQLKAVLIKTFYPRLNYIICQSEDMRNDFIQSFNLKLSKLVLIHNPITSIPKNTISKDENSKILNYVTVGRLSTEKGYLRIITGLSKITSYQFKYTIIGSGPQESEIKDLLEKYELTDKVKFIPFTSNVLEEISKNDYFLQGSFVEGFPNALLESCIAGTPIIAFKAPGGTKDIVVNEVNGFLLENENDFSDLLNNMKKLKAIDREQVRSSVINKFDSKKIIKQYEDLLIK